MKAMLKLAALARIQFLTAALFQKQKNVKTFFVPVCLSASHIAYGSIRMEPVFMVLAQSAAVAACMAIDKKQAVQQVDVRKLQQILKDNPLLDGSIPEVLVDNDDTQNVRIDGNWQRKTSEEKQGYTGNYGPSMLVAEKSSEKQSVKFIPSIKTPGTYTSLCIFSKNSSKYYQHPFYCF